MAGAAAHLASDSFSQASTVEYAEEATAAPLAALLPAPKLEPGTEEAPVFERPLERRLPTVAEQMYDEALKRMTGNRRPDSLRLQDDTSDSQTTVDKCESLTPQRRRSGPKNRFALFQYSCEVSDRKSSHYRSQSMELSIINYYTFCCWYNLQFQG